MIRTAFAQTRWGWLYTIVVYAWLIHTYGAGMVWVLLAFLVACVLVQTLSERRTLRRGALRRGFLVAFCLRKPSKTVYDYRWEIGPVDADGFFCRNH